MPNTKVLQDTRYTANIEVTKVDTYQAADRHGTVLNPDNTPIRVPTSSRVTVRSATLEDLQRKVVAHVRLLDEQDLTDEEG